MDNYLRSPEDMIAVVGAACRFPSIASIDEYWSLIVEGRELIRPLTISELRQAGLPDELLSNPHYVRAGAPFDEIFAFDAGFFGITASEAKYMDPQQRLFLELCWESLESCSALDQREKYRVGLFAGSARNMYLRNVVMPSLQRSDALDGSVRGLQADIGNYGDFLTTRVSFKLNLTGPSVNVQTACSTSLTAVHYACKSIWSGECELAIAGGVSLAVPQVNGYLYEEGSIASPDGHCRPFDEQANGTVFGNGGGTVLLKRLDLAIKDEDPILAVVRGSAANNDGAKKVSYPAPSLEGQAEVLSEAISDAAIDPASVGYIEAHGTATKIGDPIEVAALKMAYGVASRNHRCGLGSVKANLGHLGAGAGIASFIKAVLVVRNGLMPPVVNFSTPNSLLRLEDSPFFIPTSPTSWDQKYSLRRAGVSSFGIGGTNVHIIVEEFRSDNANRQCDQPTTNPELLVFSARTMASLEQNVKSTLEFAESRRDIHNADLAFSLACGRNAFNLRDWKVIGSTSVQSININLTSRVSSWQRQPRVVFAFPGQGSQRIGMARVLYQSFPSFAKIIDEVALAILPHIDVDLVGAYILGSSDPQLSIQDTRAAQPALFLVEYSLARWLMYLGVRPDAVLGHSIGAFSAACIAGIFDLKTAAQLVCIRGECMGAAPEGRMLAVNAPASRLGDFLDGVEIAAVNSPDNVVLAGLTADIEHLMETLTTAGETSMLLPVQNAFHSRYMELSARAFTAAVSNVKFGTCQIPMVSDISGTILDAGEAASPNYWSEHIRSPLNFFDALKTVSTYMAGPTLVVELGPGRSISRIVDKFRMELGDVLSAQTLGNIETEAQGVLELLGEMWRLGARIDWDKLYQGRALKRQNLPTYRFDRKHYLLEDTRPDISEKFSNTERWNRWNPYPVRRMEWVEEGASQLVSERIDSRNLTVICWTDEWYAAFKRANPEIDQRIFQYEEGDTFLDSLAVGGYCDTSVDLILIVDDNAADFCAAESTMRIYNEAAVITSRLAASKSRFKRLVVVTSGAYVPKLGVESRPVFALFESFFITLPLEYSEVQTSHIDLDVRESLESRSRTLMSTLAKAKSGVRCSRGGKWYSRAARALSQSDQTFATRVVANGKYLCTGGVGQISRTFVESIDAGCTPGVLVVLAGRRGASEVGDALKRIVNPGVLIQYEKCDVCNGEEVRALWRKFGIFDGVVHAAGVPGGNVLASRNAEQAARVIRPKLLGTLSLIDVASPSCWMILCSSLVTIKGAIGQLDYTAANCFLDALAEHQVAKGRDVVSVAWGAWGEGGMAVNAAISALKAGSLIEKIAVGPIAEVAREPNRAICRLNLGTSASPVWVLDEHRLLGTPTMPGTGFISFVDMAAQSAFGHFAREFFDISFLRPLVYTDEYAENVYVVFCTTGDAMDTQKFTVQGLSRERLEWVTFCEGSLRLESIDAVHCAASQWLHPPDATMAKPVSTEELSGQGYLEFGKGWSGIVHHERDGNRWKIVCDLPARARVSVDEALRLHSGIFDALVGGALFSRTDGPWLPFSYQELRIFGPITYRATALVDILTTDTSEGHLLLNGKIIDEFGRVSLEFDGYQLRRFDALGKSHLASSALVLSRDDVGVDGLTNIVIPRRRPQATEVEISVCASGINFKDVLFALGMLPLPDPEYQFGLECAGVVSRIGYDVTEFQPGQRVMCMTKAGHSSFVLQEQRRCAHIPEGMSMTEAAGLPVAFFTAYSSLVHTARLSQGETVLIHAATGGVGLASIQVATLIGASIIATAGTDEKRQFLRSMGIQHVFSTRDQSFHAGVMAATAGKGVNVVLNSLSGELLHAGLQCLATGGRFVEIGRRDILADTPIGMRTLEKGISVHVFNPDDNCEKFVENWKELVAYVSSGVFKPLPTTVFSAEEARQAFEHMGRGRHIGKIVLSHSPNTQIQSPKPTAISAQQGRNMMRTVLNALGPRLIADVNFGDPSMTVEADMEISRLANVNRSTENRHVQMNLSRSPIERALIDAFAEVLDLSEVSLTDSFLAQGGDSLSATQITSHVRRSMGIKVAIGDVLSATSIPELAAMIETVSSERELRKAADTSEPVDLTGSI
jgi:acyl transferase domain-containing protein/NADPH:quinone reductase-like Zn-dependent oxidoreductase/NAD(P)-dependent dehydrogenase (short-subunit alcohol dehydrogenase family)/acyl carrier protein